MKYTKKITKAIQHNISKCSLNVNLNTYLLVDYLRALPLTVLLTNLHFG